MTKKKKKKNFIEKHVYPGGNQALKHYIQKNLKYPKKAIENKIEGEVIVKFKISPLGKVFQTEVKKGIGYGCDQEAIRLINTLKYPKHTNRKLKITTTKNIKITFHLPPPIIINYEIIK